MNHRFFTNTPVNTIARKRGSNALVCRIVPDYLCIQKLIDVQQTLIANPNIHWKKPPDESGFL